ncbi:hypothetical protein RND81_14G094100 [Saponaria officinalis]|uniref:UBC core domain-containing protein n=1 Tax=Saponaria officinalis TaxID=3572 RepID=A0AAW1GMM4_SAPOF
MTTTKKKPKKLRQFDVVSDASDHQYANTYLTAYKSTNKKIMREWKLLSKELPESIYVRVYETHVELLRAAIVGAWGTPYHDGLFFFDIAFPCDYPNRPPFVRYRSFGFRLNPNLYPNGLVCLSLLHTFPGKQSEQWDPRKSNILQVLLSLQALVLNEKPFFNEAGYELMSGVRVWENRALAYNRDAFVLSCKTMLSVLSTPPKHFESVVIEHFKGRAEFILNACDMYRNGLVKVGLFDGEVFMKGKGHVSRRFTSSINKLFGDLVTAFSGIGAPVHNVVDRLEEENKLSKKKNIGLVKKLRNLFVGLMVKKKSKRHVIVV